MRVRLEIAFVYASFVFFRFSLLFNLQFDKHIESIDVKLKISAPFFLSIIYTIIYSTKLYSIVTLAKSIVEVGRKFFVVRSIIILYLENYT